MPRLFSRRRLLALAAVAVGGSVFLANYGCASSIPRRDPTGEVFPSVVGESLEKERIEVPEAFAGEPVVIFVGYRQSTQFDIDRWMLGMLMADADVRLVELPTIPGLITGLASGWIDDGMRSGIPPEDWSAVVTLYGNAASPVARFTGTRGGRNARVLLLDQKGAVVWYHDEGYSPREATELIRALESLRDS